MKTLLIPVNYVFGHLRYGHMEVTLEDEDYQRFLNASDKEKENILDENDASLVVDDYEVDDYGELDFNHISVQDE